MGKNARHNDYLFVQFFINFFLIFINDANTSVCQKSWIFILTKQMDATRNMTPIITN